MNRLITKAVHIRRAVLQIDPQDIIIDPWNMDDLLQLHPEYAEDIPAYTDFDDTGKYLQEFSVLHTTDDCNEFDEILSEYHASLPEKRAVMNWLLIRLCGYSLPHLVMKAHGHEFDPDKKHNEKGKSWHDHKPKKTR